MDRTSKEFKQWCFSLRFSWGSSCGRIAIKGWQNWWRRHIIFQN